MQTPPPALLPLLRSPFQGELLALLFLNPDREFPLVELAQDLRVSQSTVSREADRLVTAGLLTERRQGNLRMLRARTGTAVSGPLAELLAVTYGPVPVLGAELAAVAGVDEAYIYGSWAARYRGEPGDVPRDVDVLVVGTADEDDLYDAARRAERALHREVNIRRVPPAVWAGPGDDPFLAAVRERPLVRLEIQA